MLMKTFKIIFLIIITSSCNNKLEDLPLSNHIDYQEITTTIVTKPNSRIYWGINDNPSQIRTGKNHVITITKTHNPIFYKGKELTDLHSTEALLIELNPEDTLVTTNNLANSDIFIKLVAFSPDYGINRIKNDQKIILKQIKPMIWSLDSKIEGFQMKGTFNLLAPQEWSILDKSQLTAL